ncbi:MAG: hypothetical protein CMJ46_14310 [Planctomyces sp.]|nr:hypothetical protein [Planctomyces sp.]
MRVQLWLSSIAGMLLFTTATNVYAQYGGYPAPVTPVNGYDVASQYQGGVVGPDGTSYYENSLSGSDPACPPPYALTSGTAPNPYAMQAPGGYGGDPLPDRNLFEEILGAPMDLPIQINASFTRTRTKSPDSVLIGDPRVSTRIHFAVDSDAADNETVFIETPPGPATVQSLYLDGTDPFGPRTVDEMYDEGPAGGIKLFMNIGTQGSTGLFANGFWNSNYQTGQQFGYEEALNVDWGATPIRRVTETGIGYPSDEEIDYLLDVFYPGIPYYTGVPLELDSDNALGDAIPFDVYAEFKYETQTFGGGLHHIMGSVYDAKNFQIQPILGVQYMGIREGFSLFGRQSGLVYAVSFPDGEITPGTGDEDDDGGGGGDDGDDEEEEEDDLVPGQSIWVRVSQPVDTVVDSKVTSNLVGPEAGLSMVIGGDNFRIVTQHKAGLMVNRELIKLRGFGVYKRGRWAGDELPFDQTETYTHLSPMISHSVQAQSNILRHVPVIRDIDLFDEAVVSVGYNFTNIWEVARPGATIQWNGAPLTPEIDVNRETFWISGWEFGVHWNY